MKFFLIAILFFASSCSIFKHNDELKIEEPTVKFIGTKWCLTHINQTAIAVNFEKPTYIKVVDEKSFKGFGGCNQIWGVCKQMNTAVQFGSIARTKMLCKNMTYEDQLIATLPKAEAYIISGNKLKMLTSKAAIILQFQAIDEK
jgi:heat shock protein HslJ